MNPENEDDIEKIMHVSEDQMNAMLHAMKKYSDNSYESVWRAFIRSSIAHMQSHQPIDNQREDLLKYPFLKENPAMLQTYDQKMFDEDYQFVKSHLQDWYPNIKQ